MHGASLVPGSGYASAHCTERAYIGGILSEEQRGNHVESQVKGERWESKMAVEGVSTL